MPTTHDHHPSGHPTITPGHRSTGHRVLTEPHPWGDPLPEGHPGYQRPGRLVFGAFARWFVYATVLALTTTVIALVALAATQHATTSDDLAPTPTIAPLSHTSATSNHGNTQALTDNAGGDRFVQTDSDASRYPGPTPTPVLAGSLSAQGSVTGGWPAELVC